MGIEVDPVSKLINITAPTDEVSMQELVSNIRDFEDSLLGMTVKTIVEGVGKADLGGGIKTAITLTLSNEWQIQFWDGVGYGTISGGNITGGVNNEPVKNTPGNFVKVLNSVGGVITQTTPEVTQEDIANLRKVIMGLY